MYITAFVLLLGPRRPRPHQPHTPPLPPAAAVGSTTSNFAKVAGATACVAFRLPGLVCDPVDVARESVDAMLAGQAARIPNALWAVAGRMSEYVPLPVIQLVAQVAWAGHD